jgi:hypothetical protein
MKHITQVK